MTATAASIVARLGSLEGSTLRLPGQMIRDGNIPSPTQRSEHLSNLLEHDAGVFLERYGDLLTTEELLYFEPLRSDYEVDFYLRLYEANRLDQQTHPAAQVGKLSPQAKNRRLAYMQRLMTEGEYFSDESMRERAPYLHHMYVGQYGPELESEAAAEEVEEEGEEEGRYQEKQGDDEKIKDEQQVQLPYGPPAAEDSTVNKECGSVQEDLKGRKATSDKDSNAPKQKKIESTSARTSAATTLAGSIMKWQRELDISHRKYLEKEQYDMEESESDSDEDEGGVKTAQHAQQEESGDEDAGPGHYVEISNDTRMEYSATLLDAMQQRFLSGQDAGIDYRAIDADATLDDDFAEQANRDAEERYFDAD